MSIAPYPRWTYFPRSAAPPGWVAEFVAIFDAHRDDIDSRVHRLSSDEVLTVIAPGLNGLGFQIELSKTPGDKIRRPVLFGPEGTEQVAYEIDAYHPEQGIVLEVESGRGRLGNALFRDLVRTSLIVGARYLAMGLLLEYRYRSGSRSIRSEDYVWGLAELDAVFASGRLSLPFEGVLVFGY